MGIYSFLIIAALENILLGVHFLRQKKNKRAESGRDIKPEGDFCKGAQRKKIDRKWA